MRIGILKKSTIWTLRICSLILVLCLTLFWRVPGFVCSVVFIFLLDRFWPKWASDLSWDDVCIALHNMSVFGVNASRLHLRFSNRELFVYKDSKGGKKRLAVMFFTDDWGDLFSSQKALKDYAKEMNAVCYFEHAYRKEACILKPKDESKLEQECFRILKHTFNLTGKSISADAISCIDSIKRVAWRRYDDVTYCCDTAVQDNR